MPTTPEAMGDISHAELSYAVELTRRFYSSENRLGLEKILAPILEVQDRIKNIEGYMGTFGVGYPFYATDSDGEILQVPSILQYIDNTSEQISESRKTCGDHWPCAVCQEKNGFTNLTEQCTPCDLVLFKPRDLFRVLPDLDLFTVFEYPDEEKEMQAEVILNDLEIFQFNRDIRGAFNRSLGALKGDVKAQFPIDFHIVSYEAFEDSCKKLLDEPLAVQVGIHTRSMRGKWKEQPADFSYSFVFSLTEIGELDPRLDSVVNSSRQALVEKWGVENVVSMVDRSKRCGPIISDHALRERLVNRVSGWS